MAKDRFKQPFSTGKVEIPFLTQSINKDAPWAKRTKEERLAHGKKMGRKVAVKNRIDRIAKDIFSELKRS